MSPQATVAPPDTTELASRIRLAVARLARRLRKEGRPGISSSLLSALATIDRHGPTTLGDLAAHEQVQPPTMTRIVGSLVEAGFVDRAADEGDRRVAWVKVTAEGHRLVDRQRRIKDAFLARQMKALDPDDVAVLERAAGILERLVEGRS